MMNDIGSRLKKLYGAATNTTGAPIIIVAAGAGDNVANTGAGIDRQGFNSAVVVLTGLSALADTKTLSLAVEYQTSTDDSTYATAVALQASTVVATGDTGGTNETSVTAFDIDLASFPRYFRVNFTPDLNATGTDEAIVTCAVLLGGADVLPAA